MTDPLFVAAAYAIVLGGLLLYVGSLARRVRAARRIASALETERGQDEAAGPPASPIATGPSETPR